VSSTFYDLRYVREGVKRLVDQLGYIPVLSEDGTVFFDPLKKTADSCLTEVGNANMLVLVIGGRYGSSLPGVEMSVTNGEYQAAVKAGIPIFALVEQGTLTDFELYEANAEFPEVRASLHYPHADSVQIFTFIDEVRSRTTNNALVPFRTVGDIESYLRSQWASMMHLYLTRQTKEEQVADTLAVLTEMNQRVTLIAEQILKSVGTTVDATYVSLMQLMFSSAAVSDLRFMGATVSPGHVLANEDLTSSAEQLGISFRPVHDPDRSNYLSTMGDISPDRLRDIGKDFDKLRRQMLEILESSGITPEQVQDYERNLS